MALTRKFLTALGIEDDKVDQIIDAHSQTVNGLKEQIDVFKVDAEKLPQVQKELDDVRVQLSQSGESQYKEMYDQLKTEFESYRADVATQTLKANKTNAFRSLLREVGIMDKRIDAILRVSNVDEVELDEGGKVTNAEKLTNDIKTEWAEFITSQRTEGASTETPPKNEGDSAFDKMSLADKMSYANQHPTEEVVQNWLKG